MLLLKIQYLLLNFGHLIGPFSHSCIFHLRTLGCFRDKICLRERRVFCLQYDWPDCLLWSNLRFYVIISWQIVKCTLAPADFFWRRNSETNPFIVTAQTRVGRQAIFVCCIPEDRIGECWPIKHIYLLILDLYILQLLLLFKSLYHLVQAAISQFLSLWPFDWVIPPARCRLLELIFQGIG